MSRLSSVGLSLAAAGARATAATAVTAALLGALLSAPTAPRVRPLTVDTPLYHVAVIGDSYTTGTDEGGLGDRGWASLTWKRLADEGIRVAPDVASEGRAGYGVRGDHGSVFGDLTARAVRPDDVLVVFFGSRNDQGVDLSALALAARAAFQAAKSTAPLATLLVIGPPWPTADPPANILQIRDVLAHQALAAGAVFVDPLAERWFVDAPTLIGADGVHPTDTGHGYLAAKIAPLIKAQLPRRL